MSSKQKSGTSGGGAITPPQKRIRPSEKGRIFARQVMSEVVRREPIGASAFAGRTADEWDDGVQPLYLRSLNESEINSGKALAECRKRLKAVPIGDSSFIVGPTRDPKTWLDITTTKASARLLTAGEGLMVQRFFFGIRERSEVYMRAGGVIAYVPLHALVRCYDLFAPKLGVDVDAFVGIALALVCGRLGVVGARARELDHSELNMKFSHSEFEGVMITGSMKIAAPLNAGGHSPTFFDCRTVLPLEACDAAQLAQARVVMDAFRGNIEAKTIPVIARRPDFVLATRKGSRKPKH